jgi:two-component system phosphate regulon sensor histidine kinase PhoR
VVLDIDLTQMTRKPLFIKLFYSFLPVIIIGIIVLILLVNQFTRNFYYSHTENDLRERAKLISFWINERKINKNNIQLFVKESGRVSNMRVTIVDDKGIVIGDSYRNPSQMDNHIDRPEIVQATLKGEGSTQRFSETANEEQMYFALRYPNIQEQPFIRVSVPLNEVEESLIILQKRIIIIGLIIGLLLLVTSFYFSKQLTNPLDSMRIEAESYVKTLKLPSPIPIPKTKELASLAISLNKMAKEMDRRISIINQDKSERESLLSSMQEGLLALNKNLEIISINEIALDYLQIPRKDAVGNRLSNLISNKKMLSFIKKVTKKNKNIQNEIIFKTNKKRYFLMNGSPLMKSKKKSGVLITINDITLQKQLETIRQDFVANVSHELKTPITSIIGYLEIIQQGNADIDQQNIFIQKVLDHTNRMNSIIDDLLKLSKIESQEEDNTIELNEQRLNPILSGAIDDVQNIAMKRKNIILLKCDDSVMVNGDPQLLREAIINLLENAIKYGKAEKPITISVEKTDLINIHVKNHGEGIPKKYRGRIFQRFYRIDKSRDREAGGTGLGLAIVKHIALVHNGEVRVTPSKDHETCFTFSIPLSDTL